MKTKRVFQAHRFFLCVFIVALLCVSASIIGITCGKNTKSVIESNTGTVELSSGAKNVGTSYTVVNTLSYDSSLERLNHNYSDYKTHPDASTITLTNIYSYLYKDGLEYAHAAYTFTSGTGPNFSASIIPLEVLFANFHMSDAPVYQPIVDGNYEFYFVYIYEARSPRYLQSNIITFTIDTPSLPLPETPSKVGYTFMGWYYDESYTQAYDGGKITADTKLYAKMVPINYTITYNANQGIVSGNTNYNIESETYTLPIPTRTGYTFKGWYESENFSGSSVTQIAKGSTGNRTFYAKWEIQTFKVSFYVNGELYTEMTVNYGSRLADLYLVDKATMKAVAFSLTSDMLTEYDTSSAITENLSLFASSNFSVCAGLTYYIDGKTTMDMLEYGSTLSNLRTPEKDGYTFDGWFYDSEYTQAVKSTDKLTSNTTIYAKFTEIPEATFGDKVAAFFNEWWWCFAIGVGAIAIATVVIIVQKKRGKL